jgi:hypothetical protein
MGGFRRDYPGWELSYSLEDLVQEIYEQNADRWTAAATDK